MNETTGCDCAKLCDRNDKARESIKTKTGKESKDQRVVGPLDETGERTGEGTTVSSMCFQEGSGTPDVRTAHNNQKALANDDNGFVPGQDAEKRDTGESMTRRINRSQRTPKLAFWTIWEKMAFRQAER